MKTIVIDRDELYPFFEAKEAKHVYSWDVTVEVPEDFAARLETFFKDFSEIQAQLEVLYMDGLPKGSGVDLLKEHQLQTQTYTGVGPTIGTDTAK